MRTCSWCGTQVEEKVECPVCVKWMNKLPPKSKMTKEERIAELTDWYSPKYRKTEVYIDRIFDRIRAIVGPVYTATLSDFDALVEFIQEEKK